ncbi:MAG: type II toxin-antitoxin system prevent-host-death family antitoxin [Anaerolineales bacterium]|nr:type II toxin-antitoxin system prevent-host-death family antitoxin [Anaerolineales bacterium]
MGTKETSITQLRENLAKYLDETQEGPVRIMKHSETAAYLVSASEFEELVEKLEDLMDIIEGTQALEEIQLNSKAGVNAEEAFKKLGL